MTGLDDLPQLNPTELALMRLLWREGRLSAREIHEGAGRQHGWALNTTRTTLDRMVRKGHLRREEFHGLLLYAAAVSRPQGLARLVGEFARSVLELDPSLVVSLFAQGGKLSQDEVDELARIVEEDRRESAASVDGRGGGEEGRGADDDPRRDADGSDRTEGES